MDENKITEEKHDSEDMKEIIVLLKKISKQLDELEDNIDKNERARAGVLPDGRVLKGWF